jgi:hypothetical protein
VGFSSLPFTANLVPERPRVLIATDDFVHLKRGFSRSMAAGSREAIERAKPPPASALHRYRRWGSRMNDKPYSNCLPACPGRIPEAVHCTPARARRC